jgi:hypothetical protein
MYGTDHTVNVINGNDTFYRHKFLRHTLDPEPDPASLIRGTDPRIRIPNTGLNLTAVNLIRKERRDEQGVIHADLSIF